MRWEMTEGWSKLKLLISCYTAVPHCIGESAVPSVADVNHQKCRRLLRRVYYVHICRPAEPERPGVCLAVSRVCQHARLQRVVGESRCSVAG